MTVRTEFVAVSLTGKVPITDNGDPSYVMVNEVPHAGNLIAAGVVTAVAQIVGAGVPSKTMGYETGNPEEKLNTVEPVNRGGTLGTSVTVTWCRVPSFREMLFETYEVHLLTSVAVETPVIGSAGQGASPAAAALAFVCVKRFPNRDAVHLFPFQSR
jgi:hypothetical protein